MIPNLTISRSGVIATFYSYKGGTGRSMALANVGCLLGKSLIPTNNRVLLIDWDLEAPGLYRYFPICDLPENANRPGIIDYFSDLCEQMTPKLYDEISEPDGWRVLERVASLDPYLVRGVDVAVDLIKAGSGRRDHPDRVASFNWAQFYRQYHLAYTAFRKLLENRYSWTLIDSRTGLTDAAGVCTMLMPEKLVAVFTPNLQSVEGLLDLVTKSIEYRSKSEDTRPLAVFPLPSRLVTEEFKLLEQARSKYRSDFEGCFRKVYGLELPENFLASYFDEVEIPHVGFYGFAEQVAVRDNRNTTDALSINRAYERFFRRLTSLKRAWDVLPSESGGTMSGSHLQLYPPIIQKEKNVPTTFISYAWDDSAHKEWVRQFASRLRKDGVQIILDQWQVTPGESLPAFMDRALQESDFVLIVCTPLYKSRVDERDVGIGFEGHLIQSATLSGQSKFIPILRQGEWHTVSPSMLQGKYWIDLRDGPDYERSYQELLRTLRGQRQDAPPVVEPRRVYLPEIPSDVVISRREYLDTLRTALVPRPGMFLLSGEPGSGKSTLAVIFAREAQADFEAVVFQRCGQRPPETILTELADSLRDELGSEVMTLPPEEKLKAIKKWLKQRRSLLLLDDVWPAESPAALKLQGLQFKDLVPGPPVSVLFTSRRRNLPWLRADETREVEPFTREEAEAVFREYLGAETFDRHRETLLQFAQRMEFLPLAVAVGTELLRYELGPLDQAAQGLALAQLRNEIHDVPALLQRAVEAHGQQERRLLLAAAVCAPEGFWLPLALSISGLNSSQGGQARNHLVNAGLLRVVDQDRQRFDLHGLLREQLCSDPAVEEFRRKHVQALEQLFKAWETRWKECRECLPEILCATELLWNEDRDRQQWLSYWGYACASRIGEWDVALHIEQQNEQLWSSVTSRQGKVGLQRTYGNQALILQSWGRLEEALALHKKQEAICEELGDKDSLQRSYGNQAVILQGWGRFEEALALHKKEETICEELGAKDSLQRSYGNQAVILQNWGRLEEALVLHKEQEAICEELGDKDSLQRSYGNQALILQAWGRLEEAIALHKRKEAICEELGNKDSLQHSYGNQALILQAWGRREEALKLYKKKEALCIELGNKSGLGYSYWSWGVLARDQGDYKNAKEKLEAALVIFQELKMQREQDALKAELNDGERSRKDVR